MTFRNRTKANTIGTQIAVAETSLTRLVGLAGRRRLDAGCGLLIRPSSGIHTFGMLFAIDVIALSREPAGGQAMAAVAAIQDDQHQSGRYTACWNWRRERSASARIEVGDQLEMDLQRRRARPYKCVLALSRRRIPFWETERELPHNILTRRAADHSVERLDRNPQARTYLLKCS